MKRLADRIDVLWHCSALSSAEHGVIERSRDGWCLSGTVALPAAESPCHIAKAAAGDRDVMMHGAHTAQEALKAGVLDAIEIQLRPVLLGQGRRLFDGLPPDHIELDLVRTLEAPGTLHLRYDVRH
jgi:dihydrofolate reductase